MFFVGVLVDAMRKGHWIILDELNLAPSDVLEALNRVLSKTVFSCSPACDFRRLSEMFDKIAYVLLLGARYYCLEMFLDCLHSSVAQFLCA